MAIAIRKSHEIEDLRKANQIVGKTLSLLRQNATVGRSLLELDKMAEDFILSQGTIPSFKGLYGFPNSICCSLNEVIIHGIPTDYCLQEGDVIGFDVGTKLKGKNGFYFGDAAISIGIGTIDDLDQKLIDCASQTLYEAIALIEEGLRFKELSAFMQKSIKSFGFTPLLDFCGHGIGTKPHEEPQIPNYIHSSSKSGPKIKNGMVFCLEPMVCQAKGRPKILEDKWSVTSEDGLRGAHYEHAVAIIDGKAQILSKE